MKNIKFIIILSLYFWFPDAGKSQSAIPVQLKNAAYVDWNPKISPLLKIQLNIKNNFLQGILKAPINRFENLGIRADMPHHQYIYLYHKEFPELSQISAIENLGGKVFLQSWMPAIGAHPFGYVLALIPINNLNSIAQFEYVKKIDTAEKNLYPNNDNAVANINANDVWYAGFLGTNVVVGVLDSGLDSVFSDFPNLTGSKDYSAFPTLDDGIENTVTGHGTHVAGSVLGRGTRSNGTYKGAAPGAELVFLKIGSDATSNATTAAINYAIRDAVDIYDVDIITMSYGGWSTYHDGSSTEDQAVDYAVDQGVPVFISAGNEGNDGTHYSGTVLANDSTGFIQVNISGAGSNNTALSYNLVWYDGLAANNVLDVNYYDNSFNSLASFGGDSQSESLRGTESEISGYSFYADAGSSTYYVKVINSSASDQDFHFYYFSGFNQSNPGTVTFQNADPFYTLGSPATADSAIAVGAHVSRKYWINFEGDQYSYTSNETVNDIASFSSRGPRVDGLQKITITSPGSAIISIRDSIVTAMSGALVIDNDGTNNSLGPANYIIMQGTSMACPIAAGSAALLLNQDPTLQPWQIRNLLINNTDSDAFTGSVPNNTWGYGKLNIEKVLEASLPGVIYTQTVNATGSYTFTDTDISMNFSTNGTNGYVTATEVNNSPSGGTTNVEGSLHHVSAIRYWKIKTDKTGYSSAITFSYNPATDFIEDENTLRLATRETDEDTWTEHTDITRNPAGDQITANNVTEFSHWIFASELGDNSLPVELISFSGQSLERGVELKWQTASEINNLGFIVLRKAEDETFWQEISSYNSHENLKGAGTIATGTDYYFVDNNVEAQTTYFYKIADVDYSGNRQYSFEIKVQSANLQIEIPDKFVLKNAYPNPFNPQITLYYGLPEAARVKIEIYDISANKVLTLINRQMNAGWHRTKWNGRNRFDQQIASGVYFYIFKTGNISETRKIIMIK